MPEPRKADPIPGIGKWIIAGILVSFAIGALLFTLLVGSRSGDPIPPDAAPHYYIHDAS